MSFLSIISPHINCEMLRKLRPFIDIMLFAAENTIYSALQPGEDNERPRQQLNSFGYQFQF